ncbi:MAG: nuclear transport factor 2 family protein [Acidobacteria bacterium]|nr:nuclear transport factor 2 family protein [Acidobacteriota bacterium]
MNEAIFYRWIEEVWNQGKEETVDELLADQAIVDYPYHIEKKLIHGRDEYKNFLRVIRGLFFNINIKIEQIVADDRKVIAFCSVTADRRRVEKNGGPVNIPAKTSGLCQMIIEDGKIMQAWCNIDIFGKSELKTSGVSG